MKGFKQTTGKIYKDKNLICTKCKSIVVMAKGKDTSWANTKCKKCGGTNFVQYQQTTAELSNIKEG